MRIRSRTFALGAIILSFSALAACGGKDPGATGQVSIVLSSGGATAAALDALAQAPAGASQSMSPACEDGCEDRCAALQAASVTLSSIVARSTPDMKLVDVTIDLPVTVDLLALDKKQATLPKGFLPPGTYDQLVVVMTKLEVTLASGMKIAITPPQGGWTVVVPAGTPFTVVADATTTVELKFRKDLSFGCKLGDWDFHPEFECKHHEP